jgi:tRNA (guanine-N7-)-methyltransferase
MSDPPARRRIEREFGVPIPGEIVAPEKWTKTALKHIAPGPIDWGALFGRQAPVVLDIGCGNGRSTLASAVWRPQIDHLGVDVLPVVIRYATRRANQRGLSNVRFAVIGGRELLETHVAPSSVLEIHCYHPQPYYDPAQVHRRLITPEFLRLARRALVDEGLFVIQTDNPGYWRYIEAVASLFFDFKAHPGRWPDAPKGRTRREIIALRKGLAVYRGTGRARRDLSEEQALSLAQSLPSPVFDADRRLRELDVLECG